MAAKLHKGDTVIVLTGKDKGKTGEISVRQPYGQQGRRRWRERCHPSHQAVRRPRRVVVWRKPCRSTCRTWRLTDKAGKPTRVGFRMEGDKKVRYAKTTGEAI